MSTHATGHTEPRGSLVVRTEFQIHKVEGDVATISAIVTWPWGRQDHLPMQEIDIRKATFVVETVINLFGD